MPESDRVSARLVPLGLITLVFNLGGGVIAPALPLYARSLGADYRDLGADRREPRTGQDATVTAPLVPLAARCTEGIWLGLQVLRSEWIFGAGVALAALVVEAA